MSVQQYRKTNQQVQITNLSIKQYNNSSDPTNKQSKIQNNQQSITKHKTINQYVVRRNKDLYAKITNNLTAMEEFWESLPPPQ